MWHSQTFKLVFKLLQVNLFIKNGSKTLHFEIIEKFLIFPNILYERGKTLSVSISVPKWFQNCHILSLAVISLLFSGFSTENINAPKFINNRDFILGFLDPKFLFLSLNLSI